MVQLTGHAEKRIQQRGILPATVQLLLQHGDRRKPRPGNAVAVSASRRRLNTLVAKNILEPQAYERLDGVVVVQSKGDGSVITVFHRERGKNLGY